MPDINPKRNRRRLITVALITATVTALAMIGIGHMLGYHPVHIAGTAVEGSGGKTLYTCGMHPWILQEEPGNCPICGMKLTPKLEEAAPGAAEGSQERKIAYWRAPMNPTEIYDKPGKSAMGMDLVPVYEDALVGGVEVSVDPVTQQNMGVRTAPVEKGPLRYTIRTYGHVTYDETRTVEISPKVSGWIEGIHVDFIGIPVARDEPLFEIYSPDLVAAQEEYLTTFKNLQRMGGQGREMLESARQRLRYFDIADDEIAAIEQSGKVHKTLTIRSPFAGIVIDKKVVEGSFVRAGTSIYRISNLRRVWLEAHIFEYELPWVAEGQTAVMTLPYEPGRTYTGRVSYVYPYLQAKTRDVVIRIEVDNPHLTLKPDMYADVQIEGALRGEGLIIPSEAVIRSGERNVVFVPRENNKFSPREVTLGLNLDGRKVQVLAGLAPTDTVVTSGQFMLDSESKLEEAVQKMLEARRPATPPKTPTAGADDFFNDMQKPADDFFKDMK